ncbi:hypothetical protein K6V78_04960 [Streptococcus gallolyticus]|uniref:hypothetical protein n=1 Tax=Streptococcus hepaticus TaxID=3349163 RepID=UPI001C964672|nr:hypothetical protein [Streptococcus gallolyticus]MBY5040983.1 hypothetical protein [Streptococcus gallolyticus]
MNSKLRTLLLPLYIVCAVMMGFYAVKDMLKGDFFTGICIAITLFETSRRVYKTYKNDRNNYENLRRKDEKFK